MALIVADRVLETSTTVGTGSYTLAGAITGYRAASAVCVNADTFTYYAEDVDSFGRPLGGWETGLGTWSTGNILARTTIYASSNANAAVSWAAGTRRVGLSVNSDAALKTVTASTLALTATGVAPMTVASTTAVVNLNADLLDGLHASAFSTTRVIVVATAASYSGTATSGTTVILCDTSLNSVTVNLPTAIGNTATYEIKQISPANNMIIDPFGTETVEGDATITVVVNNESLTLVSDNTNWRVI